MCFPSRRSSHNPPCKVPPPQPAVRVTGEHRGRPLQGAPASGLGCRAGGLCSSFEGTRRQVPTTTTQGPRASARAQLCNSPLGWGPAKNPGWGPALKSQGLLDGASLGDPPLACMLGLPPWGPVYSPSPVRRYVARSAPAPSQRWAGGSPLAPPPPLRWRTEGTHMRPLCSVSVFLF